MRHLLDSNAADVNTACEEIMLWVQHSAQATQFRIWATQTLREFIVKGFVLDDERLKLNRRFIGEHRLWSPVSEWWLGQELARMNGCKCKFGQRY